MYPYELTFSELVDSLADSLRVCSQRNSFIPFENVLIGASLEISDSGDSRRCSAAMQTLRKRGLARFNKRYRAWIASSKLLNQRDKMNDAADRCALFIEDIVKVCKKHRVLIELDDDSDDGGSRFAEQPASKSGYGFTIDLGDLENSVRLAVWDDIYGNPQNTQSEIPKDVWRCVSMHDPAERRGVWFAVHNDVLVIRGGREGDDAWAEIQKSSLPDKEFSELVSALEYGAWQQEDYGPNTRMTPFKTKRE